MILCCVATTFPLVIGLHNGQLGVSIYGALTGYLLTLNDHLGTLKERIQILTLTFIMMIAGFAAGFFLHDRPLEFVLVVGSVTYWMGILGGNGAELERAVLFTVILIIISFFSIRISPESLAPLFSYALLAYGSLMVAIPILIKLKARAPEAVVSLRSSFRQSLSKQREKHIHAASYTLVTIFSIWLVQHFNIERGYWIIITVLLVMR
ncbi:MAG: hypothetical protein ACXVA9_11780, partial [Bdellovibrionales bacterium]